MDLHIADISSQAFNLIAKSLQEEIAIANPIEDRLIAEADAFIAILEVLKGTIAQRAATLRQKRNALVSRIHGLPSELLSLIFEFSAESFPDVSDCSLTKPRLCSRFPHVLTTVCSRWYKVAISTPRVWSYICSRQTSDDVQLYLDRSKNSPVDITYHNRRGSGFVPQVIPHLPRLRTLHCTSDGFIELAKEELEKAHTPILESVYLMSAKERTIRRIEGVQIFKHALQLQKLEIVHPSSYSINWETIYSFSELNYLKIHDLGEEEPEGSLIGSQYHRLFKSLPCLKTVIIRASQRDKPSVFCGDAIGGHDPIIHDNIRFLYLTDVSATLALTVASFLHPSHSLCIHSKFFRWSMEFMDPDTRIQLPSGNIIEHVVSQVRRLRIDAYAEHRSPNIQVQGLTSETSWDYYQSDIPITDWRHVLRFELITQNPRPFLPLLSIILPTTETFKRLKSLRIRGRSSISLSDVDLPTRLGCFPLLEEIWLEKFSCPGSIAELNEIFKCLGKPIVDEVSMETEERWICPNLSKIELHEVALDVPDLLEMLRNRGMVDLIPDTPPVEGPASPLELLVVDQCCTFSNSSSCGELVVICNQQLAGVDETSRLVSHSECDCIYLLGAHNVIQVAKKTD